MYDILIVLVHFFPGNLSYARYIHEQTVHCLFLHNFIYTISSFFFSSFFNTIHMVHSFPEFIVKALNIERSFRIQRGFTIPISPSDTFLYTFPACVAPYSDPWGPYIRLSIQTVIKDVFIGAISTQFLHPKSYSKESGFRLTGLSEKYCDSWDFYMHREIDPYRVAHRFKF